MSLNLPDFSQVHILVIGDVMLDRYWHGSTTRISPEAPVPVVRVQHQEERPGGAANVALNISALGAKASLLGVTGDDAAADTLQSQLHQQGVHCLFQRIPGVPTITKLRVLSRHQQLIRLDFEEGFNGLDSAALHQQLLACLPQVQVMVLSDYGKGALADPAAWIAQARAAGKPVIVDPKGRDFSKYRHATLLTPNLSEFETIVGVCPDQSTLEQRGEALRAELQLDALLITRSEQGMSLLRQGQPPLHLPAHAREVYDVTGAGDTVIGVLGACLGAGQDLAQATALANLAAGLAVAKLGTASVPLAELEEALHSHSGRGIQDEAQLLKTVRRAQANGETVVMTNGCFDVLHAGHVQYLTQARQLGDRLIVAVNDDDSVRRLKGHSRPVNPLAQRMAVLAGLEAVDWVVPFSEDTPERLICQLLPEVLVKGGDYRVEEIAGHRCILDQGGRVVVLDFLAGCSTTALIHAIRSSS